MIMDKLTLNLVVSDALKAATFYEKVFNGTLGDIFSFSERTGENEANVTVGGLDIRLIDENASYRCFPPKEGEADSMWLQFETEDLDTCLRRALEYGATIGQEISEFMGTRYCEITDPYGYTWTVNQIIRKVSYEERYQFYKDLQDQRDAEVQESADE
jgi:uncharacterized glyoxalase superfamily protein PhnB